MLKQFNISANVNLHNHMIFKFRSRLRKYLNRNNSNTSNMSYISMSSTRNAVSNYLKHRMKKKSSKKVKKNSGKIVNTTL